MKNGITKGRKKGYAKQGKKQGYKKGEGELLEEFRMKQGRRKCVARRKVLEDFLSFLGKENTKGRQEQKSNHSDV